MSDIRVFEPKDVVIDAQQAKAIFYFFWPDMHVYITPITIDDSDRSFAQAVLVDFCQKCIIAMPAPSAKPVASAGVLVPLGKELATSVIRQIEIATMGKIRQFIRGQKPAYDKPITLFNTIRLTVALAYGGVARAELRRNRDDGDI